MRGVLEWSGTLTTWCAAEAGVARASSLLNILSFSLLNRAELVLASYLSSKRTHWQCRNERRLSSAAASSSLIRPNLILFLTWTYYSLLHVQVERFACTAVKDTYAAAVCKSIWWHAWTTLRTSWNNLVQSHLPSIAEYKKLPASPIVRLFHNYK